MISQLGRLKAKANQIENKACIDSESSEAKKAIAITPVIVKLKFQSTMDYQCNI